jgi:ferredoxin--NADP+ reductase
MTDLPADDRPIVTDSALYTAAVSRREDLTDSLAFIWVKPRGDFIPFEPGQYLTIGVESAGKLVQRPYSVASSPRETADGYEFYVRLVQGGTFTPLLWRLPVGHGMSLKGPKGKFVLEAADDRTQVFISSGTGVAPFISMLKTLLIDGAPRRTVVLHGASYADELGYRALLESWQAGGEFPLTYVPTVSRPRDPRNTGWAGRVGRVEAIVPAVCDELGLTPDNAIAYLCGNPDMIATVDATLLGRGFPEAQVKKELYWPKGKEPRGRGA